MKLKHLHYLTGVCRLFLCGAVNANVIDCQPRSLTATVDDIMRLYMDGVDITNLTTINNWRVQYPVKLPCNATVIGIQGTDLTGVGGILASTDDGYVITNSSWKCTNRSFTGWQTTDFDDSDWPPAVEAFVHDQLVPGIRKDAFWIWTTGYRNEDPLVYCRKTLDIDECLLGPPENQCNARSGHCINTPGSYKCRCYQGFTNVGDQRCEVSTGNDSTSLTIVGVILGVSVLANLALLSATLILYSRNKTMKNKGQSGVEMETHQNNTALDGKQNILQSSPAAGEAYENLNSETLYRQTTDAYETLRIK